MIYAATNGFTGGSTNVAYATNAGSADFATSATSASVAATAASATTASTVAVGITNQWIANINTASNALKVATQPTNATLTALSTLNAVTLTNLNGTNIVGVLTNNTTGNAATATLATAATAATLANNITAGVTVNPVNGRSVTNLGGTNLDYAAKLFTSSGQQSDMRVPPWVINGWSQQETTNTAAPCLTNLWDSFKANGWYDIITKACGTPYIFFDYPYQATNRDAGGNMQISPYFQSGTNIFNTSHTKGYKNLLWMQESAPFPPFTSYAGIAIDTPAKIARDVTYFVTNNLADGFWWDSDNTLLGGPEHSYGVYLFAQALAPLGRSIFLTAGLGAADGSINGTPGAELDGRFSTLVTSTRVATYGDPGNWTVQTNIWDYIQRKKIYKTVHPGHFLHTSIIGYFSYTTDENESDLIMHAMLGSVIFFQLAYTDTTLATNSVFLDIYEDPAVIGAERRLQTNSCDVYVKPRGSPNGPNFAVSALNITSSPKTITINWTNIGLPKDRYFTFDVKNAAVNDRTDPGLCYQTTVTLAAHASALFHLQPPSTGSMPLPVLSVPSGTAWTTTTMDNYDGPWGPSANWYARSGYRTVLDAGKHVIWPIPDSARWAMISVQFGNTATCAFTNAPGAYRFDGSSGGLSGDSSITSIPVYSTNGIVTMNYTLGFLPNKSGEQHFLLDTYGASTNATAILKLLNWSIVTF